MQDCVARRQVGYDLYLTWEHAQRQIFTVRERKALHAVVSLEGPGVIPIRLFYTDPFKMCDVGFFLFM